MNKDLAFSAGGLWFWRGAFFLGYSAFQIPANLILERVGARRWIFLHPGGVGCDLGIECLGADSGELLHRAILLGVAEAGFFPRHGALSDLIGSRLRIVHA